MVALKINYLEIMTVKITLTPELFTWNNLFSVAVGIAVTSACEQLVSSVQIEWSLNLELGYLKFVSMILTNQMIHIGNII